MRMREGSSPIERAVAHPQTDPEPRPAPQPGSAADDPDDLGGLPDGLLVERAAEGDDDAFAVLVYRHSPALLALAHRLLGDPADAEEALQDALVSAWRRLPEFRGDATFRTWMYRIVTNRCLNVMRRRDSPAPLDAVPEPAAHDAAGEPARAAESAAATEALAEALGRLRADQRACWVLRELQGLSYDEIAEVVGASEQTVRGRLFRARRTLMKEMAPWR
jgi:RNA polymerase sigma-70 factor (ECF subfamily)